MKPTCNEVRPDELHWWRRHVHKQAVAVQFACCFRNKPLVKVLEETGISIDEFKGFWAGRLAPDRKEWQAIHKALNMPPETIMDMAIDDTPEVNYES